MLIAPPYGCQAAWPVSSYRTIRTFGASLGALGGRKGSQSGFESRMSSLITPLKVFSATVLLLTWATGRLGFAVRAPAGTRDQHPASPSGNRAKPELGPSACRRLRR